MPEAFAICCDGQGTQHFRTGHLFDMSTYYITLFKRTHHWHRYYVNQPIVG